MSGQWLHNAILGVVITTAACLIGVKNADAAQGEITQVGPVVRLANGKASACGVSFSGSIRGEPFAAEFVLRATRFGPMFRLSARYRGTAPLSDLSLETDYATTAGLMPRPGPAPDGSLQTEMAIPGLRGSEFMRSLMETGGRFLVGLTGPKGDVFHIAIPGPLSQQIRDNYQNCKGDLVRP